MWSCCGLVFFFVVVVVIVVLFYFIHLFVCYSWALIPSPTSFSFGYALALRSFHYLCTVIYWIDWAKIRRHSNYIITWHAMHINRILNEWEKKIRATTIADGGLVTSDVFLFLIGIFSRYTKIAHYPNSRIPGLGMNWNRLPASSGAKIKLISESGRKIDPENFKFHEKRKNDSIWIASVEKC